MKRTMIFGLMIIVAFVMHTAIHAQNKDEAKITVEVNKPGHKISPTLFGIFFEDINLAADGGLYPELVRNRSFEDSDTLQFWKFRSADGKSSAKVISADVNARQPITPLNAFNRKSLCIKAGGKFTLENDGYWGMNLIKGNSYTLNLSVRVEQAFNSSLKVKLVGSGGNELSSGEIKEFGVAWKNITIVMKPTMSDAKAHLEISGEGNGTLYFDMISLLPDQTWKNHGMRVDLAEALDKLQPKFLRFPGGCWVEGEDFAHMNNWKYTIGNLDTRTSLWNLWGYNATNGLGYHEYLQLAEDLGAEPLFCVNAGISHKEFVPLDKIGQWIQDALDAIEYANGPVTSVWGSLRAKNGHPKPFNLKYLEIGNENFGQNYYNNYELIAKAVLAKYPNMKLIANDWAGGHPQKPLPEIIDEHYYNDPDWFIRNANKYDNYDRKGPKIFIGEYAVTSGSGKGNLRGAIGEAAWMTGMERNSDVVVMGAYAPLFCNVNHKRWPINLINFDSYRWYGLPSYYVQQMFANNQGKVILPVKVDGSPIVEIKGVTGGIGLGTWNNAAEFKDLKVVSPDGTILYQNNFSVNIDDWTKTGNGIWSVKDGVLRQASLTQGVTAYVGDDSWKDYTITLKARKLYGDNGFQIYFHNPGKRGRNRWDLGGYNNTVNEMTTGVATTGMNYSIVEGRWYDLKIETKGNVVKGYVDGKLIQEAGDSRTVVETICASASRDAAGDIILKVVNADNNSTSIKIDLKGAGKLPANATAIVLTSTSSLDENTLEEPNKVSPKIESLSISGNTITKTFSGNSLTIIRIPVVK